MTEKNITCLEMDPAEAEIVISALKAKAKEVKAEHLKTQERMNAKLEELAARHKTIADLITVIETAE